MTNKFIIDWYFEHEAYIPIGNVLMVPVEEIKKLLNANEDDIKNLTVLINEFNKVENDKSMDEISQSDRLNEIQELIREYIGGIDDK